MQVQLRSAFIPEGDAGISDTVQTMVALARRDSISAIVCRVARVICSGTRRGGSELESAYYRAAAIRQWVADRFVFEDDPEAAELVYSAETQLRLIAENGVMLGDCDDAATLVAAIAIACDLDVRLVCVGFTRLTSSTPAFTHVWAELRPKAPGAGVPWLEMDVTKPMQSIPVDRIGRAAAWRL